MKKIFVSGVLFLAFIAPHFASAALYNASDLFGQYQTVTTRSSTFDFGGAQTTSEQLSAPYGIVLDKTNHRLFVSDVGSSRIMVFQLDSSNNITTTTAAHVLGQLDFDGSSGALGQNHVNGPGGLAYDEVGMRLFVADTGNNRVLVFDANPLNIADGEDAAYVLGEADFDGNPAVDPAAQLSGPLDVAYDSVDHRLFVADRNNARISIFNVATISNGQAASKVIGASNFSGGAPINSTSSAISDAHGLALDVAYNRLFVVDPSYNRILVFNVATSTITNGEAAQNVLGQVNFSDTSAGGSPNGLWAPQAANYDPVTGRLFVSNAVGTKGIVFNAATSTITNGENYQNVFSNGVGDQGSLGNLGGLFFDTSTGKLFVADVGGRATVYDATSITDDESAIAELGQYTATSVRNGSPDYTSSAASNGESLNARGFNTPTAVALDAVHHRLFVSDLNDRRVLVFALDENNNRASTSASYVFGQADFTSIAAGGGVVTTASGVGSVDALAYDSVHDRLFLSDKGNFRIMIFDTASSTIHNGEDASYVLGQPDFVTGNNPCGFGCTFNASTTSPDALRYDPVHDRLFAASYNRVSVFNVNPATLVNGKPADYVLGQPNFSSGGYLTSQSGMGSPFGLAYDSANERLFVAEDGNHRVGVWNVDPSAIHTGELADYVLGQIDFTTSDCGTTQTSLCYPEGLAYDSTTQHLYVSDNGNARVVVYDVATSTLAALQGIESQENVIGQTDFISSNTGTTQSKMNNNREMDFDPVNNNLFVTDISNHRVLQFDLIRITTNSLAAGTSGTAYSDTISATSTQGTVSYVVQSGSLPAGLSLNSASGAITGTPTTAGASSFTIEARDGFDTGNFIDRKSYSITIAQGSGGGGGNSNNNSGGGGGGGVLTYSGGGGGTPIPPSTIGSGNGSGIDIQALLQQLISLIKFADSKGLPLSSELRTIAGLASSPTSPGSGTTKYLFQRDLRFGMLHDEDIRRLQLFLIQKNLGPAAVALKAYGANANFGYRTQAALIEYQKYKKIDPALGFFGPLTRAAVNGE